MNISIIMTSYNYEKYIREAIESVIAQSYKNWELIIIDDGSSDNSIEIIEQYVCKDSRVKLYTHKNNANKGIAESIKLGLKNANSEWIAFLESDDAWKSEYLEEIVKVMQNSPDIIFSIPEVVYESSQQSDSKSFLEDLYPKFFNVNESGFINNFGYITTKTNLIPTFSTAVVKKELLEKCNFNSLIKPCLDYYLWSQLTDKKIYYINKKLAYWRVHENSYITKADNNKFTNSVFKFIIYKNAVCSKKSFSSLIKILQYFRRKLVYIKYSENCLKVYLLNKCIANITLK